MDTPTYRNWLQTNADQGDLAAGALLQVVGDDFGLDQTFLSNGVNVGYDGREFTKDQIIGANENYTHEYNNFLNPGGSSTSTDSGGQVLSSSTGSTDSNADDLAYLDTQAGLLRNLLNSARTTRDNSLTQLGDSYNKERSSANQQRERTLEDYQLQREDSTRGKQQSLNVVDTNARTLANSLRRILGMASGSGSSAYQLAMPSAVARQASGQRSNVLNRFGQNERDLTLAEQRATEDYDNLLQSLLDQRKQRESGIKSGIFQQEQGIFEDLAGIAAERARIQGGGYDSIMAAQDPYLQKINNRQSAIDALFNQYRTPYDVQQVNPQAPNLRDYTVDRAAINANRQSGTNQSSPYQYLLRRTLEEDNQV